MSKVITLSHLSSHLLMLLSFQEISGRTIYKSVTFRAQINPRPTGSHPINASTSPMMGPPKSPMMAAPCTLALIQERGAKSTLEAVALRLRQDWRYFRIDFTCLDNKLTLHLAQTRHSLQPRAVAHVQRRITARVTEVVGLRTHHTYIIGFFILLHIIASMFVYLCLDTIKSCSRGPRRQIGPISAKLTKVFSASMLTTTIRPLFQESSKL
jgi:hypothetical protein